MSDSFWDIFDSSSRGHGGTGDVIVARSTPLTDIYIGTDRSGALTVVVESASPSRPLAAFELAAVRARFDVLLDLDINGVVHRARCSVLQCLATDRSVQRLFLSTVESLVMDLPSPRAAEAVHERFQTVVWMFSRLVRPASMSVTGLIGELAVVVSHPDPVAAVHAWRVKTSSRFDFTFASYRLEVKSTTTRTRSHEVSFEQVNPPAGAPTLLASVWVEEALQGMSGAELLDVAVDACASDAAAALRVREVVSETMGERLQEFLEIRVDESVLRDEMRVYRAEDVPAFRTLPPGVSAARFVSDLSFADPVEMPHLSSSTGGVEAERLAD